MADVFISYARPDEGHAERVASALRTHGFTVWRDDELPAHRLYAEVIQERLKSAGAVVVLWSAEAAKSQWVRSEADAARQLGTLIQATTDGALPPMPFDQIHCADLSGWNGNGDTPGWAKLRSSVAALAGTPSAKEEARVCRSDLSVCVLPFANMSGDPEQEYFSDGISEDITTDLSKVSALEVIARNTAFQFKNQSVDVGDIAKKLGVTHVLEGSVRKAGNRVRITAQLIDGKSGGHIWADRYDRDLTDIFAIQDELSKAIVEALKVKLLPGERKAIEDRGTSNPDAYDLYLMARQTWQTGVHGDTRREETVIRLCDRIIGMQPDYGRAWALKALALSGLRFGYNKGTDDGVAAADRALELDPSLGEAHAVRAHALAAQRNFDDAEREVAIALQLAPDSWDVNREAAAIYLWQHKFAEAVPYYEKSVELDSGDRHSLDMLCMAYRALGDGAALKRTAERLLHSCQAAVADDPNNSSAFGRGANALVMLGEVERSTQWIDRALLIDPENLDIRYNFACTLINEEADLDLIFEHLEFVFARSVGSIIRRADIDTDLDGVRDHPRFQAIYSAGMERIARLDAESAEKAKS